MRLKDQLDASKETKLLLLASSASCGEFLFKGLQRNWPNQHCNVNIAMRKTARPFNVILLTIWWTCIRVAQANEVISTPYFAIMNSL